MAACAPRRGPWFVGAAVLAAALAACGSEPKGPAPAAGDPAAGQYAFAPVFRSPLGRPLDPRRPTPEQEARIRRAQETLAAAPRDVERIIEAAQALESVWRYNDSTALYTRGIDLAPNDYRLYLNRAHRIIRLRRLDLALADLERSVALDPYGFNSSYLLALTYYLRGEFDKAANEYSRCMALASDAGALALAASGNAPGDPRSCMSIASDNATRVAITAWRYRALRRAGRNDEAARLLDTIRPGLDFSNTAATYAGSTIKPDLENRHYYATLLLYRGLRRESEVLDRATCGEQWATVAYGVAFSRLASGDQTGAVALLREGNPRRTLLGPPRSRRGLSVWNLTRCRRRGDPGVHMANLVFRAWPRSGWTAPASPRTATHANNRLYTSRVRCMLSAGSRTSLICPVCSRLCCLQPGAWSAGPASGRSVRLRVSPGAAGWPAPWGGGPGGRGP